MKEDLLNNFLKKVDLFEPKKYKEFIRVNKSKKFNESKAYSREYVIE